VIKTKAYSQLHELFLHFTHSCSKGGGTI